MPIARNVNVTTPCKIVALYYCIDRQTLSISSPMGVCSPSCKLDVRSLCCSIANRLTMDESTLHLLPSRLEFLLQSLGLGFSQT